MMLFAIVFGLSMDYEVFLLSRIREEWDRTGDSRTSVADGLASTARVITAAAAIMVVVFGSFLGESDRVVKLFGLGLSVAVLIDATIVRLLLVPATMELLGDRNWWIPRWLDRILPRVHIEAPPDLDAELAQLDRESQRADGSLNRRRRAHRRSNLMGGDSLGSGTVATHVSRTGRVLPGVTAYGVAAPNAPTITRRRARRCGTTRRHRRLGRR